MRAAWPASKAEAWLFDGTERVDDALNQGFKMSAVNLKLAGGARQQRESRFEHELKSSA